MPPSVFIEGQLAVVGFTGRAPGYQGLDQINIQVPSGIRRAAVVPVIVTSGKPQQRSQPIGELNFPVNDNREPGWGRSGGSCANKRKENNGSVANAIQKKLLANRPSESYTPS